MAKLTLQAMSVANSSAHHLVLYLNKLYLYIMIYIEKINHVNTLYVYMIYS